MFSSRSIRKDETPLFQVRAFDVEDQVPGSGERPTPVEHHSVTLPVGRGPSPSSGVLPGEDRGDRDKDAFEAVEDRLARLEREAYEKGFEQGRKDGLALEERQMGEKERQLEALFSELRGLKHQIYRETEKELVELGLILAKKVIRREIRIDKGVIGKTIEAALVSVADKSCIRIMINPEDMEEVGRLLPSLTLDTRGGKFEVLEDPGIARGGCYMETGFGDINATLEDQLAVLEREMKDELACRKEDAP